MLVAPRKKNSLELFYWFYRAEPSAPKVITNKAKRKREYECCAHISDQIAFTEDALGHRLDSIMNLDEFDRSYYSQQVAGAAPKVPVRQM